MHQTFSVSTTQFKISRTHLTTQTLKQTSTSHILLSQRRETDEHFQTPLCFCACMCALVAIVCYWVSLAVCFHSHSQSLSPLFPSYLIFLTLTVLCNSCKTLSAPKNHFMHFLLRFCHSAVFKYWFTLVAEMHTHTYTQKIHSHCYQLRMGI